jgi:hypothetical protein
MKGKGTRENAGERQYNENVERKIIKGGRKVPLK